MDVAMLDGFLTALAVGPALVPPSEWLPRVWGVQDEEPDFESLDQAERILGLLMRLYNQNFRTLTEAPESFAPLLPEWEQDGKLSVSGEEWCAGFGLGVGLRVEDWRPLFEDDEARILLGPMIWLSSEQARQEMGAGRDPEGTHRKMLVLIGLSVIAIYKYWEAYRNRGAELTREPSGIGRKPRVGRNDPCPCGSGKKFKKCCGA